MVSEIQNNGSHNKQWKASDKKHDLGLKSVIR